MATTIADVAVLDRVIAGGGPIAPANLKEVRIGVVAAMLANLDGDTEAAFRAALDKLRKAGVTVIDVEMPKLGELNAQVAFPVALYEPTTMWSRIWQGPAPASPSRSSQSRSPVPM
jgi:indoleacetamide hydrolase